MSNNKTFACSFNSTPRFEGMQNQTTSTMVLPTKWSDAHGLIQSGQVILQPNDYAVRDREGNWRSYNPTDFAAYFTVTSNY